MKDSILTKIINENPTLCDTGFKHEYDDSEHFEVARNRMHDRGKAFNACVDWLKECRINKRSRTWYYHEYTSYQFKRFIENRTNLLIPNGVFIAAVLYMKIPYKSDPDNPNIIRLPIAKTSKPIKEGRMTY